MKNTLIAITFLLLATACAKDSSNGNSQQVATVAAPEYQADNQYGPGQQGIQGRGGYRYEYPGTGCTTGSQRFENREQYCAGLRDDRRNNNCALNNRYQDFRQYCNGRRWQR